MKAKFLGIVALGIGMATAGAATATHASYLQQEPDNTSANKQDQTTGAPTADQQKENPTDREMARKIRKSIVNDKTLSTYGHNVKIIVRDGMVTLKGPVQSDDEKMNIEKKAAEIAGADKVQNQLTVKS